MVYRKAHQHVCVPFFFLVARASDPFFGALRKKNETPNTGQTFCIENTACRAVREKLSI